MTPLCSAIVEYLDKYQHDVEERALLVACLAPILLADRDLLRRAVVAACAHGYDRKLIEICAEHVDDVRDRVLTKALQNDAT